MDFNQWWAVVAPATTPIEIVERIRSEITAALAHPSTKERLSTLGIELKASTRDELRSFMRDEVARWGNIARQAGVKPE
jgi:tripartite-type tricarboxylate transporter receptor subunit TctC